MDIDTLAKQYAETTVDYANMGYNHNYVRRLVADAFKAGADHQLKLVAEAALVKVNEKHGETLKKLG